MFCGVVVLCVVCAVLLCGYVLCVFLRVCLVCFMFVFDVSTYYYLFVWSIFVLPVALLFLVLFVVCCCVLLLLLLLLLFYASVRFVLFVVLWCFVLLCL